MYKFDVHDCCSGPNKAHVWRGKQKCILVECSSIGLLNKIVDSALWESNQLAIVADNLEDFFLNFMQFRHYPRIFTHLQQDK